MAFKWTDLIAPGMSLGGSLLGNKMQADSSKAGIKEEARQFDTRTARSDQARNMLMPAIQQHLGYAPQSAGPFGGGMTGTPSYVPEQKSGGGVMGTLGKIGGAASGAAGLAGLAGMGGLGSLPMLGAAGPIGGLAAGGIMAAKLLRKIGAGRRTANKLTDDGGIQSNLQNAIHEIDRRKREGQVTPEQAEMLFEKVFRSSAQRGVSFAAGDQGNKRKVVEQMLNTYNWNPTMARIAPEYLRQLG